MVLGRKHHQRDGAAVGARRNPPKRVVKSRPNATAPRRKHLIDFSCNSLPAWGQRRMQWIFAQFQTFTMRLMRWKTFDMGSILTPIARPRAAERELSDLRNVEIASDDAREMPHAMGRRDGAARHRGNGLLSEFRHEGERAVRSLMRALMRENSARLTLSRRTIGRSPREAIAASKGLALGARDDSFGNCLGAMICYSVARSPGALAHASHGPQPPQNPVRLSGLQPLLRHVRVCLSACVPGPAPSCRRKGCWSWRRICRPVGRCGSSTRTSLRPARAISYGPMPSS